MLRYLLSKYTTATVLAIFTVFDVLFTILILRRFKDVLGSENAEQNVILRQLFSIFGIEYTMLLLFPLAMLLVILCVVRFWDTRGLCWPVRIYACYLCLARIYLLTNNFSVLAALITDR